MGLRQYKRNIYKYDEHGKLTHKWCPGCNHWLSVDEFVRLKKGYSTNQGISSYCASCLELRKSRTLSLDYTPRAYRHKHDRTYYNLYTQSIWNRPYDPTYEKVFKALAWWISQKIITKGQAEAIYLHAVELLGFKEIAEYIGMGRTSVSECYRRGIQNLRRYYGIEVSEEEEALIC